jgi:hypothetical protein
VALSADGSTVAMGLTTAERNNSVAVYNYVNGTFAQLGVAVGPPVEDDGNSFGHAVVLSGNGEIMAVGTGAGENYVAVFRYDDTTRTHVLRLVDRYILPRGLNCRRGAVF